MNPARAPTLHIVFSPSAAVDLRQALQLAARPGEVVAFFDDLTFGPIDPPDPQTRAAWAEEELLYDWDVTQEVKAFWETALNWTGRRIVWTSRRVATERAGFLEWVRRAGDGAYDLVDLSEVLIPVDMAGKPAPPNRAFLPIMPAEQIAAGGVLDLAVPTSSVVRDDAERVWTKLRREGAPFRRLVGGELVSAPIDTHDSLLLRNATHDWEKAAYVIGRSLAEDWPPEFFELNDVVLFGRLRRLLEAGALEGRGDPSEMRKLTVRLPEGR
jgi:hypothetical protein